MSAEAASPFEAIRDLEQSMRRKERKAQSASNEMCAEARADAERTVERAVERASQEVERRRAAAIEEARETARGLIASADERVAGLEAQGAQHRKATVDALLAVVVGDEEV
jgi:hypothetical protein